MKRATKVLKGCNIIFEISIHALMKRATHGESTAMIDGHISIHALMKRATDSGKGFFKLYLHFNPRPHEEGDQAVRQRRKKCVNFNPRPHEEGDEITFLLD